MRYEMKALFFTLLILLGSCTPKTDTPPTSGINDFRAPGGGGSGEFSLSPVFGLTATVSSVGVQLDWIVPAPYRTSDYKIHIYRSEGPSSFNIPDPRSPFSSAVLYKVSDFYEPAAVTQYFDTNTPTELNIVNDTEYTYHVYIELDDEWSEAAKVNITTLPSTFSQEFDQDASFWDRFAYSLGFPSGGGGITSGTITPYAPQFGSTTVFSPGGAFMYVSDPLENRVMIYVNEGLRSCLGFPQGTLEYALCSSLAVSIPYTPFGVLGQRDFTENFSCQDAGSLPNNQCLTNPTGLEIFNNRIIISDTGNNRIVSRTLTEFGCYNVAKQAGDSTPTECEFTKVIGQKGVEDIATYDVLLEGESSLNQPLGIKQFNGDLYIADSGNNRVVKACRFLDETIFNCASAGEWQTNLCSFCAVLGQPNLTTKTTLEDEFGVTLTHDPVLDELSDPTFLRKFFKPIGIDVIEGNFVIHSREDFFRNMGGYNLALEDRFMLFPLQSISLPFPNCREETFDNTDNCEAQMSIGTVNESAPVYLEVGEQYLSKSFTLSESYGTFLGDTFIGTMGNKLFFLNDYMNNSNINLFLDNPAGSFSSELGVNLPDFQAMDRIYFNSFTGQVFIFDRGAGRHHAFTIYNFNNN